MTQSESETRPPADDALRAAKPPVGVGASPLVAQLIAIALVALGAVGVQALLSQTGAIGQAPWTTTALEAVDGTGSDSPVVLVVAVPGGGDLRWRVVGDGGEGKQVRLAGRAPPRGRSRGR